MITAIDTNVLSDVLRPDPVFGVQSKRVLASCRLEGGLIACDIVWAEIGGLDGGAQSIRDALLSSGIDFSPLEMEAALLAGETWRAYRGRGGQRQRMIADFLIGAHAQLQADRLLTRDRGFYRAYFPKLVILDPTLS